MLRRLLTLLAALCVATAAVAAEPALLRRTAVVDGDVVRLGDLFENAGAKADTVLMHAPQPGRRIVLGADWLTRVAAAYGLGWRALTEADRVVVERRSRTVDTDRIMSELQRVLAIEGAPEPNEIQLYTRNPQIHVAADAAVEIEIRDIQYDQRTGRFSVTVEADTGSAVPVMARLTGRAFALTDVPVLNRAVPRGEIIADADVEWQSVRRNNVQRGILSRVEDVVGRQARTDLRPGQLLRSTDVQREIIVAKNSLVTILLRRGGLQLTAQGRAVEDGGLNETIRVVNTQSKVTVEAKVEGPNVVSVVPMGQLAN